MSFWEEIRMPDFERRIHQDPDFVIPVADGSAGVKLNDEETEPCPDRCRGGLVGFSSFDNRFKGQHGCGCCHGSGVRVVPQARLVCEDVTSVAVAQIAADADLVVASST